MLGTTSQLLWELRFVLATFAVALNLYHIFSAGEQGGLGLSAPV